MRKRNDIPVESPMFTWLQKYYQTGKTYIEFYAESEDYAQKEFNLDLIALIFDRLRHLVQVSSLKGQPVSLFVTSESSILANNLTVGLVLSMLSMMIKTKEISILIYAFMYNYDKDRTYSLTQIIGDLIENMDFDVKNMVKIFDPRHVGSMILEMDQMFTFKQIETGIIEVIEIYYDRRSEYERSLYEQSDHEQTDTDE